MMKRWATAWAACALAALSASPAEAADPLGPPGPPGPPATHRFASVSPPGRTAWLIAAKSLIAFTKEGAFFALEIEDGRLRAKRIPVSHPMSALVPPAPMGGGSFAGAERGGPGDTSGGLVIVSLPGGGSVRVPASAPLSPLSRPVALNPTALAAGGRDGSVMVFEKRGGAWRETGDVGNSRRRVESHFL